MQLDITSFRGDPIELKWNRKGLTTVAEAMTHVKDITAAVQAGGCLGVFAKYMSQRFNTVYVFEPSTQFVDMTHNAPEANIIRFQAALGCKREMVTPVNSLDNYDASKMKLHSGMTVMKPSGVVPTLFLDDLNLPNCGLLFLDVEGYELNALRGAIETIKRCRPVIVVEVNQAIEMLGQKAEDLRTWLRVHGAYEMSKRIHSDEIYLPC